MFDFHEKRRMRRIFYSKPFIAIVFVLAILMLWSSYGRYVIERDMAEKLANKKATLGELEERAQTLKAKVDHLESERGIEDELRSRFDVVKEGEQAVIILNNDSNASSSSSSMSGSGKKEQSGSWYDLLKFW